MILEYFELIDWLVWFGFIGIVSWGFHAVFEYLEDDDGRLQLDERGRMVGDEPLSSFVGSWVDFGDEDKTRSEDRGNGVVPGPAGPRVRSGR